jgi:hypothetical protein
MTETQEYFVVFTPPEQRRWWTKWLEEGYGHCYVVWWDGFNWLRMCPELTRVVIEVLPWDKEDVGEVCRGNTAVHIELPVTDTRKGGPWLLMPATCVEVVKVMLGIRAWYVLTPRQLFSYLVARKHEWWWRFEQVTETTDESATCSICER